MLIESSQSIKKLTQFLLADSVFKEQNVEFSIKKNKDESFDVNRKLIYIYWMFIYFITLSIRFRVTSN